MTDQSVIVRADSIHKPQNEKAAAQDTAAKTSLEIRSRHPAFWRFSDQIFNGRCRYGCAKSRRRLCVLRGCALRMAAPVSHANKIVLNNVLSSFPLRNRRSGRDRTGPALSPATSIRTRLAAAAPIAACRRVPTACPNRDLHAVPPHWYRAKIAEYDSSHRWRPLRILRRYR